MWSWHRSEKPAKSVRFAPPAPDVADAEADEAAGCGPVPSEFKSHRPPHVLRAALGKRLSRLAFNQEIAGSNPACGTRFVAVSLWSTVRLARCPAVYRTRRVRFPCAPPRVRS